MKFDAVELKLIEEALYHLAVNTDIEIEDTTIAALSEEQLENRLLRLRQRINRELLKIEFQQRNLLEQEN